MTSEVETLKTNEFLRRRKLRLQQVREQSKDIAKKIRQRTKVEKLRQVVDIDAQKEKEYLERQEIFLRELEKLHAKRLNEVGAGHENASKVRQENTPVKTDLSRLRGKEATSELRRKKQEKLDEQKKLLDRKLQAREAANEISREKSTIQGNKLLAKGNKSTIEGNKLSSSTETHKSDNKTNDEALNYKESNDENAKDKNELITKNDMATQWDLNELGNEWEPRVPLLPLTNDNGNTLKETANYKTGNTPEQNKKLDLFAVSDEMPSSLRGGLTNVSEELIPVKPSLTLITEHLQNRALNLRDNSQLRCKRRDDDLSSIKQTIMKTRTSKCKAKASSVNKSNQQYNEAASEIPKRTPVTMYNHETRDIRDIFEDDEGMVVRHSITDDDAYSQAMKESFSENAKTKVSEKKVQDMRSKVAVAKHNVEKEYKETMEFLNSLPKESNVKPIKQAYVDEIQEQIRKDHRQRQLQEEFHQIERECRKNSMNSKSKHTGERRSKSKSPSSQFKSDDRVKSRNFQYSWMPVPESDGKLAIHTIPNSAKSGKSSNTVKFSEVDSYHEYRTRHRHTPPTKENSKPEKQTSNGVVEFDLTHQSNQSTDLSTASSNSSSVETVKSGKRSKSDNDLSDAEKILIYKILDSKNTERRKVKKCSKSIKNTAKSLRSALKENINKSASAENNISQSRLTNIDNIQNMQSVQDLREGVYKKVNEGGDNLSSIYLTEHQQDDDKLESTESDDRQERSCSCVKSIRKNAQHDQGTISYTGDTGDIRKPKGIPQICRDCKCEISGICKKKENQKSSIQQLATTSSMSFRTATSEKAVDSQGYIQLIDDGGQEAGKFYIGASGLLKNDAYEVVIQLRKKDETNDLKNQIDVTTKDELMQSKTQQKNDNHHVISPILERKIYDTNTLKGDKNKHCELKSSNQEMLQKQDFETVDNSNISSHKSKPASLCTNLDDKSNICNKKKEVSDKNVGTSFNLSNEILCTLPKSPPISRAATSAYTQTTLNSPNTRPVLIHMSSSTSTAYMSPPEIVLPNFMKKGYYSTSYDIHRPIPIRNVHVGSEYIPCQCRQCIHNYSDNGSETKFVKAPVSKKTDSFSNSKQVYSHDKHCKHKRIKSESIHVRKHTCNKNTSGTKNKSHARSQKSKKNLGKNNSVANYWASLVGSRTNRNNRNSNISINKRLSKSGLNPQIKKYVHKLLALSRQSLRAMEVVNEECSSVVTPESSIINMPRNIKENYIHVDNRVSLQQIKDILKEQFLKESKQYQQINMKEFESAKKNIRLDKHSSSRVPKWKPLHKVKSLNISKNIYHYKVPEFTSRHRSHFTTTNTLTSSSSSTKNDSDCKRPISSLNRNSTCSKRQIEDLLNKRPIYLQPNNLTHTGPDSNTFKSNVPKKTQASIEENIKIKSKYLKSPRSNCAFEPEVRQHYDFLKPRGGTETSSTYSNFTKRTQLQKKAGGTSVPIVSQNHYQDPVNISTLTSRSIDSEINFVKVAEDKLQNMEKIADLTEKCTQRLSNLAKVLEDVRRNKSLAYSQISTAESASDSEHNSDKNSGTRTTSKQFLNPNTIPEVQNLNDPKQLLPKVTQNEVVSQLLDYVPFLIDIPKPETCTSNEIQTNWQHPENTNTCISNVKQRCKPPPALSRINLKHEKDYVIPHELSTVIEVDSPMSVKLKSQSRNCEQTLTSEKSITNSYINKKSENVENIRPTDFVSPDVLRNNLSRRENKNSSADSSGDSKLQMMDLQHFNEIMLKPFISIQDYAKQCGPGIIDEGSNLEELRKDSVFINEELSSMHSDGSLPDVVAELLKRNIITEPFKYDSVSNVNSTTVSSDSTLSIALTKIKQKTKEVLFQTKEDLTETSESLSISSNPDLEKAFQKLGLGWASSTLKKTKERLALSSSSNTSGSSLAKNEIKNISKQNIVVPDSFSTILNVTKRQAKDKVGEDNTKNAEQQTALTNSMTVKEFLTNELAKRITFTNKSNRNDIDEEFVSLYETKMPDEIHKSFAKKIKFTNKSNKNDTSEEFISLYETKMPDEIKLKPQTAPDCNESANSGSNKITRTSTPVQIYKSITYRSSSSSNVSNGLFTNADDLSSVKITSNSVQNHSTSEKDDLTIPNYSLRIKKASESSRSD